MLEAVAPLFYVSDVHNSATYYRNALGFSFEKIWGEPPCFCMVERDGLTIMLQQNDHPRRPNGSDREWDAYFWVVDADRLFEEIKARGATIAYAPTFQAYYGNQEFAVTDPDGYLIAFGHNVALKKKRESGTV